MVGDLVRGLRVATVNVRGLAARRKQYQVNRLCAENQLDLVAIQETKVESEEQTDRMVAPFTTYYNACVCHSVGTSGGCLLLVRKSLDITEQFLKVNETGRLIVYDFSFSGYQWRLICVYVPNDMQERSAFFAELEQYLQCERYVILLGDFNCVCYTDDRAKRTFVRDKSALLLNTLVQKYDMEDVGRLLMSATQPKYTHFQRDSHARLDRVYVSLAIVPICSNYGVKPVSFSDHSMVHFEIGS